MSYNAQAESFSRAAAVHHGDQHPMPWTRFDQLYSEICDATPCDGEWRASDLIGKLPTIQHFAPRTQRECLAVVIRDMRRLRAPADGIERVRGGIYHWVFARKVPE